MIVYILVFCAFPSATMAAQPASKGPIQTFTQEIERLRIEFKIPGLSVAVLQGQQVIFANGFGYADIKDKIPAIANTPYNIASCTKPFAAAVLMKLVEEGQLCLDDEMAKILNHTVFPFRSGTIHGYANACEKITEMGKKKSTPFAFLFQDYRCYTERITVRHHLTHTSQGVPGDAYRYNGFLYGLLSHVAGAVSGKGFADLLVENIIAPLEMTRTVPSISDSHRDQVLAERAKYYRVDDRGNFVLSQWPPKEIVKALEASGLDSTPRLNAGGGMISTVLDLAKFDIAMDRNLIVSDASKEAMFTSTISNSGQPLPYGLGWFVQEYEGVKIVWHYGWAPKAYSSLILKVPKEEVTLILLANSDGASAPFRLGEGNVLNSPFAVMFINLFTKLKVKANILTTGAIQNVYEPDKALRTYIDINIGKGFTGNLPDDIDTITVTGPKGNLPIEKDDFIYLPKIRDFWIKIHGSPDIGTYTFTVTSGNMSGSAKDTQSVLRTIPLPDTSTFSPSRGEKLSSNTPTFSWGAVKAEVPVYYRLEINKLYGGRVYATGHVKGMLSHTVPYGVLKPGQACCWRVRAADGDNWIKVENRSHSKWISFTMAK
jgi:CubicO group peptidase (beta-lactamase class C family)